MLNQLTVEKDQCLKKSQSLMNIVAVMQNKMDQTTREIADLEAKLRNEDRNRRQSNSANELKTEKAQKEELIKGLEADIRNLEAKIHTNKQNQRTLST